ncbi:MULTISPECIES: phage protease [unclassified Yoonia]|uniref:phage protease n=1 Tax=unclassified Yoonia TaxID=2629118 RepID=UPI002AFF9FE5|nr:MULTISPECIES: phage protease [unclassified Yoonia]
MNTAKLIIALCAAQPSSTVAMCASQDLPPAKDDGDVPEWIHLLPAGNLIQTGDARGPYHVASAQAVITASFAEDSRLPIDENHSTDLAAPRGEPAPALGWIVEMQARDTGIWGRVEWNASGRDLVKGRAYRGISPVILHDKNKNLRSILRASLVNKPNLRGMTALHQQQDNEMDWMKFLAEMLGLPATATEDEVKTALTAKMAQTQGEGQYKDKDKDMAAVQSQLSQLGVVLGLGKDAKPAEVLTAATQAAKSGAATPDEIVALQSELATVVKELNTIKTDRTLTAATSFVDAEIKRGRAGLKPLRDRYIALHQRDPAEAEALINGMPILGLSGMTLTPPPAADGTVSLNAEQSAVAAMLGMTTEDYAAQLALDTKETL